MLNDDNGYPCPCCGFLTLSEGTHTTFEICPVCNWEDDDVQFQNPDFRGGANLESLNEARENYKKFGASSLKHISNVRAPFPDEIPVEYTEQELRDFSLQLVGEGEEEELSTYNYLICESAEIVDSERLTCPHCHEAWECPHDYKLVRCPNCDQKLRNPRVS